MLLDKNIFIVGDYQFIIEINPTNLSLKIEYGYSNGNHITK